MRRFALQVITLLLTAVVGAFAQDEPEGTLWVRAVYTGTYSKRDTCHGTGKSGPVNTSQDKVYETWAGITLTFTGTTNWRYRQGVPFEMKEDSRVLCSGGGGLRNLTRCVEAVPHGGELVPFRYQTMGDGSWTYAAPTNPARKGVPPLASGMGSVVLMLPLSTYTIVLSPFPNVDQVETKGGWTWRIRPQRRPGDLHDEEDREHTIAPNLYPSGALRPPQLAQEGFHKVEQELHTLKDMRGTWDPKQPGFSVSGHLSRSGGPGTKTTRTEPVNRGDETSTGLVTTLTEKWAAEVSWTYSYNRSPVEAVIKPAGEYKKWIPPASTKQGTAGGTISFNVELRDKKTGGKPKNTTATFQFKLLETSKEPGSCMNSPWNDTEPDLKILKDDNAGLEKVDPDGQGARSKPELTECPITVSCFDGGAHGRLQVVAELSDGPPITAILQEDGRTEVGLPYDEDGNHIADAWEQDKSVSGQSGEVDDEQAPPGDRTSGDGLTLWEEYRGFLEDGEFICGDPKRKDYFLCDTVGGNLKPGIQLFRDLSKLEVHSDLTVEELGTSRVINRNHAQGPHVVDQHGVILGQRTGSSGRCEAIGGPATPKGITEVVVHPATETQRTIGAKTHRVLDSVVAHELLHTCNVWHHGHFDALVWWQTEKDAASGATVFKEYSSRDAFLAGAPGLLVVVECEDGTPFRPLGVGLGARITLGNQRGQHSGCESCVMRYSFADAAVPKIGNVRYFLTEFGRQEEPGAGLCTTAVGTGVNAPSRSPRARYGNAAEGRGDCADQIRVNDAY